MQYNKTVGSVNIHIDTKRMDENLRKAQNLLDAQVLKDMKKYIPQQQGDLREKTIILQPGLIVTYTPYAHYQYVGLLRTDEEGRAVVEHGKTKPVLTKRPLVQHTTGTTDHWFEEAKRMHGEQWLDLVRSEAGKG